MTIVEKLRNQMVLPVIGAPMFIVGNPDLVIEQCKGGIIGSFPALNARPAQVLDEWLDRIEAALAHHRQAIGCENRTYAVNQIISQLDDRLDRDLDASVRHRRADHQHSLDHRTMW